MSSCFNLINNFTEISNNKYILNTNYSDICYGLYDNSNNNYLINSVSKNFPLTFYSNQLSDISHIINFELKNKNDPIIIYVSKGKDISYNNGDYFRFYDISYQLLNINYANRSYIDSSLTDVSSNFYFMNNVSYKFIAIEDFCANFPFCISGSPIDSINLFYYLLKSIDNSFIITIPENANNSNNSLFYYDCSNINSQGKLHILRDNNNSFYYGDISFSIINYNDASNILLSLKSYNFNYNSTFVPLNVYGNANISNEDIFYYSQSCEYIITGLFENANEECLNKVSTIDISINLADDSNTISDISDISCSFNKNNHNVNSVSDYNFYDYNFGMAQGDYIIIDICKNFPFRLVNEDISNLIYIDESYQVNRIKIIEYNFNKYYHGSLKIKVVNDFSNVSIEFLDNRYENKRQKLDPILSKLFYSNSCINHISYNNLQPITILQLKNQEDIYYDLSESELINNIYDLKLDENYIEKGYLSKDRFNNDILDKVIITPPFENINNEISNNLINRSFIVYYEVLDYENNVIRNIRNININSGPIIEISSNLFYTNKIYKNDNPYNLTLLFQNNTFNDYYNFYNNINVYVYDTSKQKINIPFEITLTGNYYDTNFENNNFINNDFLTYTDNVSQSKLIQFNNKNYYSSSTNNLVFKDGDQQLKIKNIESINFDNSSSNLHYINNVPNYTSIINYNSDNQIENLESESSINTIKLENGGDSINLTNVIQEFDSSYIILEFTLQDATKSRNCIFKINNHFFELQLINSDITSDNLTING